MVDIVVGKRYTSGFVDVRVKEIREDIMLRDYNDTWVSMVVCDTPSSSRDVGLPLTDLQDHFEEDTNAG
jgi:hypothetical protein